MSLTSLACEHNKITDLTPLRGMQLVSAFLNGSPISDLTPLAGMPLRYLDIRFTGVTDLTPLRGIQLTSLICSSTSISDVSPLVECRSMPQIDLRKTKVTAETVAVLQKALPKCKIDWDDPAKAGQK